MQEEAFQAGLTHVIFFSLEISTEDFLPTALDRLPPDRCVNSPRS